MPDIKMCGNDVKCPVAAKCRRSTLSGTVWSDNIKHLECMSLTRAINAGRIGP